jgi:hypothetical protein
VKISYNNGSKWAFYLDGAFIANSTACHTDATSEISAGAETTDRTATIAAQADTLQKRNDQGVWNYDWPGSLRVEDAPCSSTWLSGQQYQAFTYGCN